MRIGKNLKLAMGFALVFFGLFYLETQLPFFKKFLPVEENKLVIVLLNLNLLLILLLIFLVTRNLVRTYFEKKRGIWGSNLKLKLASTFLFISIVPSLTLFILASGFFHASMEKWFGTRVEEALDSASEILESLETEIALKYKAVQRELEKSVVEPNLSRDSVLGAIEGLREKGFFKYYLLTDSSGEKISGNFPSDIEERLEAKFRSSQEVKVDTLERISKGKKYEFLIYALRISVNGGKDRFYVFLGDDLSHQISDKLAQIKALQAEFKKSRPYKKLVKYGFFIPLFLVTLVGIFFSTWLGMKLASAIVTPIEQVKEGASIIARGKFDISLEDRSQDEIGTLVSAFNSMARQLKIAKDEIEEKSRYLEIILDNVATGILTTDRWGRIVLMNNAARRILGIEDGEWRYKPLKELLSDDLRPHMRSFLREMRKASGKTVTKDLKLTLRDRTTYIRASISPIHWDGKELSGFIIAIDDITHVIRAERLSLWQEIAKKLAHEIKNPLTPITLSAERLKRRFSRILLGRDLEILEEATSSILNSAEVIKNIVNDLTRLTPYPQSKKHEDLNEIITETLTLYHNAVPNITLRFEKGEIPKIYCDRDSIKRILFNLLSNSIRALHGMEGYIEIRTSFDPEMNRVLLEVSDNGKGIPDEDKPKIFDPYFTREKDGTGLGLAIVSSIVMDHGGKIKVEDNNPRGTRFTISFPL